eukprot:m.40864 g.40864  ORF g.40864 m.40864 type:complete len:402 (-) comp14033_c0_seq1:97-1302(-)
MVIPPYVHVAGGIAVGLLLSAMLGGNGIQPRAGEGVDYGRPTNGLGQPSVAGPSTKRVVSVGRHAAALAPGTGPAKLMHWWGLPPDDAARCSIPRRQRRNVIVTFSSYKRSTANVTMLMFASFLKASTGRGIGGAVSKGQSPHDPSFELVVLSNRAPDDERYVALQEAAKQFPAVTVSSIVDLQAEVKKDTPWAQSRHFLNMRPLYFLRWMRTNPLKLCPDDGVAVADEDLVYQGDPFDILEAIPGFSLYAFAEKTNYTGRDGLNKLYVEMATGSNATRDYVGPRQVFCFGFALGDAWAIRALHDRIAVAIYVRGFEATDVESAAMDQGMLNVLIHTGSVDDLGLRKVYNEEPWVTHLTSQLGSTKTISFDKLLDTRRVVHQYKWANEVRARLTAEYGYKV